MALFTVKKYKHYRIIVSIIQIVFPIIFLIFILSFFHIIYKGVETKDYTKFCYAIFAGNAIICNSLLAFGRSPIFIDRFKAEEQKLIYFSATMFLYSAICAFFLSGWVYVNTDQAFLGNGIFQTSLVGHYVVLISLTAGIGVTIILSLVGVLYFFKWSKKAIDKVSFKQNEEK